MSSVERRSADWITRPVCGRNAQQAQVDDRNRAEDQRQPDDVCRLDQGEEEQRIANLNGQAGLLEPVEERGDVHYCPWDGDQLPQTWS